jgi:hypothetical protein
VRTSAHIFDSSHFVFGITAPVEPTARHALAPLRMACRVVEIVRARNPEFFVLPIARLRRPRHAWRSLTFAGIERDRIDVRNNLPLS